jgi:DUF1365 family protein
MTPALCTGTVMHARFAARQSPAAHAFVYPLFFLALPLSRLDEAGNAWFGVERARPASLRFRDHGARDGSPPEPWIRRLLAAEGITAADGEVVLQTFPRLFGFVFNPVSFWFCHDRHGALRAVLAEVRNTFGDHHNYLIAHADQRPISAADRLRARKLFHVSPFFRWMATTCSASRSTAHAAASRSITGWPASACWPPPSKATRCRSMP